MRKNKYFSNFRVKDLVLVDIMCYTLSFGFYLEFIYTCVAIIGGVNGLFEPVN